MRRMCATLRHQMELSASQHLKARRAIIAFGIGALFTALRLHVWASPADEPSDFAQLWAAAGGWLAGKNPYSIVGPGRAFDWLFPLLYPFPAVLVAVPFSFLTLRAADAAFVGLSSGALAWSLTRTRIANPQLLVFASLSFTNAVLTSEWSPVLVAAALTPALGALLAVKPTIGAMLFAAYPRRQTAIFAAVFVAISLVLLPTWPRDWIAGLHTAVHMTPPILLPGGFLLALVALRWRRPEARLLAAMACVPHTPILYETVPLFLVVESLWEGVALLVLTFAAGLLIHRGGALASFDTGMAASARWLLWLVYLPAMVMILVRPNQAPVSEASQP